MAPVPNELTMWVEKQRLAQKQEITGQVVSVDLSFQMKDITRYFFSLFVPHTYIIRYYVSCLRKYWDNFFDIDSHLLYTGLTHLNSIYYFLKKTIQ